MMSIFQPLLTSPVYDEDRIKSVNKLINDYDIPFNQEYLINSFTNLRNEAHIYFSCQLIEDSIFILDYLVGIKSSINYEFMIDPDDFNNKNILMAILYALNESV